jgi:hypothetical protein
MVYLGLHGKPKGVMQDHRYVLHLYGHRMDGSRRGPHGLLYSPSFAGAVRDVYCALLNGAALLRFDVKREGLTGLADWLRHQQITVFFAVATMFRHFCRLLSPEDRFPSVRCRVGQRDGPCQKCISTSALLRGLPDGREPRRVGDQPDHKLLTTLTRGLRGTVSAGYAAEASSCCCGTRGPPEMRALPADRGAEPLPVRGYWGRPERRGGARA